MRNNNSGASRLNLSDLNSFAAAAPADKSRYALWGGAVFAVLLLASVFIGPEPPWVWATDAQPKEWFLQRQEIWLAKIYLRAVTALSMVIFVGGLVGVAQRARGRAGALEWIALSGGVIFSVVMFISLAADATAGLLAGQGGEAGAVRALAALGDTMRHLNAFGYALMVGAATASLWRARAIPRPLGWMGVLATPLFLAAAAGFPATPLERLNLTAVPFLPLWPLALSVTMLFSKSGPGRRAA